MSKRTSPCNAIDLLAALGTLALITVACSQVKQAIQPNKQSDAVNEFNYSVPNGTKNAEEFYTSADEPPLFILLHASDRIHLESIESQPVTLEALSERIRSYAAGKADYDKAIFITAASDVDASTLNGVLNELRKHEIDHVSLTVSSVERRQDRPGDRGRYERSLGDIPSPDRALKVRIRSEDFPLTPGGNEKPNPLTLIVRLYPNGMLALNNEACEDSHKLASKLNDIFYSRESNGVVREGTNEVEKTVLFQIDHDGSGKSGTHKYGDLIRVIDAMKGAGAYPIVLIDSSDVSLQPPGRLIDRTSGAPDRS